MIAFDTIKKMTPEAYIKKAGPQNSLTIAYKEEVLSRASGYVSPFWTQVKQICEKKLGVQAKPEQVIGNREQVMGKAKPEPEQIIENVKEEK